MDDEYTTDWSDAIRTEAAFLALESSPQARAASYEYGTLGTALWSERCLARVLALSPCVGEEDPRTLVAGVSADRRWLQVEPGVAAVKLVHAGPVRAGGSFGASCIG